MCAVCCAADWLTNASSPCLACRSRLNTQAEKEGEQASLPPPGPTGAPIHVPMPEPFQSARYGSGAGAASSPAPPPAAAAAAAAVEQPQPWEQPQQQQRAQRQADPFASMSRVAEESPYASPGPVPEPAGGARFRKMMEVGAKASEGNSVKEKVKAMLLSRYAPDDMSPQAVALRKLVSGAEAGFSMGQVRDRWGWINLP